MTLRQLQQVAYTYLTRPNAWGWFFALLYAGISAIVLGLLVDDEPRNILRLGDILFALLLFSIVPPVVCRRHALAWQFAHPRAALTPGFAAPHLAIVAAAAILCMLIAPIAIASATSASSSFCLAIAAMGVLISVNPRTLASLAGPLFLGGKYLENHFDVGPWINAEGYRLSLLIAVAAGSWLLILRGILRDATGREEGPRILPVVWSGTNDHSARPFRAAKQALADAQSSNMELALASRRIDRAIARLARHSDALPWRKLRLASSQLNPALSGSLIGAFVFAAIFLNRGFTSSSSPELSQEAWWTMARALPLVSFGAAMVPVAMLANHIPQMSFERLLPMSNAAYAASLLINPARTGAVLWLTFHIPVMLAAHVLPWKDFDPPSIATIAAYTAISWAGMTLTFGASACCTLAPNIGTALLTGLVSLAAMLSLPSYWQGLTRFDSRLPVIAATILCAIVGAFLIQHAYAGWRDKELG